MKFGPITNYVFIGLVVGIIAPFAISICLFGTTLQGFIAAPAPKGGFWSGAPTPAPTPIPSEVQVVANAALSSGGGAVFVLWSVIGAFAGETLTVRRFGKPDDGGATRRAWLGALAGSVIFIVLSLFGLPR